MGKLTPKQKRERRAQRWRNVIADIRVYAFCLLGVVAKRAMDFEREVINLRALSLEYVAFAAVIAILTVVVLEMEGDAEGKRKNLRRRAMMAALWGFAWQQILMDIRGM